MSQALSGDKLLNTLLSHTDIVGIFVWDFDGRILQANDAFLRIVGYEREDLAAGRLRWPDLTPPDLLDGQAERLREHKRTGRLQTFEKEYFRKDGTRVPVLVGVSRFEERGDQGVAFVLDVSEHKRAEAEHRAHVWFLESLDRINRTMQAASDLERVMSDVLEAVLEVLSCDRAWLVYPCDPQAASWRVVMERTRPQCPGGFALQADLPTDAGVAAGFAAARAASGAVLEVPAMIAERFAVRSRMAMAVYPKGDAPYLFGVHQCSHTRAWTADEQRLFEEIGRRLTDALSNLIAVRNLRESERRLESAQRIARVGWWERDYETRHVSLSDEACRIFGVRPVDLPQWQGRWLSLIHPEDRSRAAAANEAALGGGPRYDVEYRVERPDGTVRVVHSQGDVIRDEAGRPVRQFGVMQDITELRSAEQALRDSEQRYRTLFEKANDAIFLENERDEIIDVNEQACALLGYSRDELLDMTVADLQAPEVRGLVGRVIRDEIEKHGSATFESVDLHRSGRRTPVEVTNTAISYLGQKLVLSVVRDITERKRAEDRLRESEARFRTFVDHATDAFFLLDEQLCVVDVNRQACESLGWSREQLIGMQPGEFDVGLDASSIARLAERAGAGEIVTFETRHRRKDGTVFPVEIRTGTFRQGGKLLYLALVRDVSERKRAEEELRASEARFRTFVDHATDGFFLHADDSTVIDVNQQACASLGYSREELIGMHPRQFDAGLDRASLARMTERIGTGESVTFETLHRRKDGSVLPVEVRVRQFQHGKRRLHASLVRDITERKRTEAELREKDHELQIARTELARVSRLTTLGELTTSIAHEVSQPLGAMMASAAAGARWLAAEPPDMAEARAALDNIAADGKRAREVIARIRALTKRQVPRTEELDINQKILQVLALTEHELRSHGIVLRTRLDSTLPRVAGDRVQLQQVLLNLIMNAVEAMSAVHDRTRQLTIVSGHDGASAVLVEVLDSGIGLDPARADRLFEPFYTTKAEGIGIGLSISRSIVEAHGGRLWASANEPHGAVFRFSLPVAEEGRS
jgi:PAS domain S-box-containing protein